jgi:hypothetical protein
LGLGNGFITQNVSLHLENLELNIFIKKKAYESIINYCDKIKFFRLTNISYENIRQFYELILHLNKHLKYLSLQMRHYDDDLKLVQ